MTAIEPVPVGRRQRKKDRTRAALLDATRVLLDEGHVDGVNLATVAELADVSTRTLFRYFDTKAELVLEACEVDRMPWRFDPPPMPRLDLLAKVVGEDATYRGELVRRLADDQDDQLPCAGIVAAGYLGVDVETSVRHLAHQVLGGGRLEESSA